jgi:hypothetical protein
MFQLTKQKRNCLPRANEIRPRSIQSVPIETEIDSFSVSISILTVEFGIDSLRFWSRHVERDYLGLGVSRLELDLDRYHVFESSRDHNNYCRWLLTGFKKTCLYSSRMPSLKWRTRLGTRFGLAASSSTRVSSISFLSTKFLSNSSPSTSREVDETLAAFFVGDKV